MTSRLSSGQSARIVGGGFLLVAALLVARLLPMGTRAASPDSDRVPATADEGGTQAALSSRARTHSLAEGGEREAVSPHVLSILVVTSSGQPVANAVVSAVAETTVLGSTDSEGQLMLTDPGLPLEIRAEKPGYGPCTTPVPRDADSLTVTLHPEARLYGTTVDGAGRPLPACRILVHRTGTPPVPAEVVRALQGASTRGFKLCTADDEGNFAVSGLRPHVMYTAHAGLEGNALAEPFLFVATDQVEQRLELVPIYCANIHLEELEGGPLVTSSGVYGEGPVLTFPGDEIQGGVDEVGALLAGVGAGALAEERDSRLVLCATPDEREAVLVPFYVRVPGYQSFEQDLLVNRVGRGASEITLRLARDAMDWGSLRIVLASDSMRAASNPSSWTATTPQLIARMRNSSGRSLEFRLQPDERAEYLVDSLPADDYSIALVATHKRFKSGVYSVRIGSREMPELRVDVSGLGGVRIELRDALGDSYEGRAVVRVRSKGRSGFGALALSGPPYVIDYLPAGPYELEVLAPGLGYPSPPRVSCEVRAGRVTSLSP